MLLALTVLLSAGCVPPRKHPPIQTQRGEREEILTLVAQQVAYTRVTSMIFKEGATHATVRVWTSRHDGDGRTRDCVVELEKVNGRWFIMQVNDWRT